MCVGPPVAHRGENHGATLAPSKSQKWHHSRRMHTEEKAKVVAAVWGTDFIQFWAALAVLLQDDMKKRKNYMRML